jgi:4-amino-4-deoxy-L-arabinose transferase-like glycosyltransferase
MAATAEIGAPARTGISGTWRRLAKPLPVLCALALLVRLAVVFATPHFIPATDAADYDKIAVYLADHGGFPSSELAPHGGPTAFREPVWPLVLAGSYELSGTTAQAQARWRVGRVLEAVLGVLVVALMYLIARRLWGRRIALLTGAIAVVYPPLLLVNSSLMSESVYIPLVLGAVLASLVHRESRGVRWAVLAGVLLGLTALGRSNGIALLLPILLLVWPRPRRSWPALRSPLIVLAATLATLAPWTIRNAEVFRRLIPISTDSGYAVAGTYNSLAQTRGDFPAMWVPPVVQMQQALRRHPADDEAELSNHLDTIGIDYIKAHPSSLVKTAVWSGLRMLDLTGTRLERVAATGEAYPPRLAELSVYAFWLIGLLALAGALTPAARRAPPALWGCPVVIFLSSLLFIGTTRYRSPADPFILMLAALGGQAAWTRLRARRAGTP